MLYVFLHIDKLLLYDEPIFYIILLYNYIIFISKSDSTLWTPNAGSLIQLNYNVSI